MTDTELKNHEVKFLVLIENLRIKCKFLVEVDCEVCSRVKKHHDNGRIAFMRTTCSGNIRKCRLSSTQVQGDPDGTEIWKPEEGIIVHNEEEK